MENINNKKSLLVYLKQNSVEDMSNELKNKIIDLIESNLDEEKQREDWTTLKSQAIALTSQMKKNNKEYEQTKLL